MKIELEIDDKYLKTNLHLMWGIVPIARWKWTNQYWEVKSGFCSQCGKCCARITDKSRFPFATEDGCWNLTDNSCSLGMFRPTHCSLSDSPLDECTIEWKRYG